MKKKMKKNLLFTIIFCLTLFFNKTSFAYPIFAQQNYLNPREPNGRIVCANCHLAQKPVEIEVVRLSNLLKIFSKYNNQQNCIRSYKALNTFTKFFQQWKVQKLQLKNKLKFFRIFHDFDLRQKS
eukprot:TRINITY_DN1424_c0_g1_i5.p2 TRINITY_DN1424_c0_g1~~TRINITY_DN1424_c0_g1_i5.p2  ORF type:complete len:125 (-),score=1.92 TRINITY_DN1424_c0_g1_i5:1736-2110(-)